MDGESDGVGTLAVKRLYPLFVGQIFALILTALTLIVVARLLAPSLYGLYSFAFAFQAFVDGIGAWGIAAYLNKELSAYSYKKDFKNILDTLMSSFAVAIPVAVFFTLLGVALSGYVANVWFTNIKISQFSLQLVSLITFFIIIQSSSNLALIGLNRSDLNAIVSVSVDIMQLALSILFITYGYGVNGAIAGMLVGYAVGTAISFYFLYNTVSRYGKVRIQKPTKEGVRRAWHFSVPAAANNFLNNGMQNFGLLFLGLYVFERATLGNYGAALKGLGLLSLVYGTIGTVLLPTFADVNQIKKSEEINKTYNRVITYALALVFPLLIYIIVFATPGLYVTVSGQYTTAPIFLMLIAIGTLLNMFGAYVGNLLISRNYTKEVLIYNLYSTIIEFISLVILVPIMPNDELRVIGAVVASFFIGNIASTYFFVKGANKIFKIAFEYGRIVKLVKAAVALAVLLLVLYIGSGFVLAAIFNRLIYIYIMQLALGLVLTALVYPILVGLFGVINAEDIKSIRRAVGKLGKLRGIAYATLDYSAHFMKTVTLP